MTGRAQLLGLAFFFCTLLAGGCVPSETDEKVQTPQGNRIKEIPAEQRKAELLKQLNRRFEDADSHYELGRLYQADGLWREAEYHYNVAMSFDPVHWPAQAGLVKLLQDSGNPPKAKLSAEIYMNQVSTSAERSLQLGLEFQKQDLGDYALACYQQALDLAPNSAKIHRQIGYYYLSRNDKERARQYLISSYRIDPHQPDVAGELGLMGVRIKVPPKTEKNTKKLDKIVEESEK